MRNKYTKENLQDVANKCTSFRQMLKEFGLKETGGNYSGMQKRCEKLDVDTSHFTGQGWNKLGHPNFGNNIDLNKRFVKHEKRINAAKTKDILLNHKLKEYKCEICGLSVWNDKPIILQLQTKPLNRKNFLSLIALAVPQLSLLAVKKLLQAAFIALQ